MDPDIKQRRVAALRSGKYEQTVHDLRTPDGYCCLGVLCDLYDPSRWSPLSDSVDVDVERYQFNGATAQLPTEVYEWAALDDCDPEIVRACNGCGDREGGCDACFGEGHPQTLSELNDSGWSFAQIANMIEEQL